MVVVILTMDLKPTNMLPIFENGLKPSLLGVAAPTAWFSEYILFVFCAMGSRIGCEGILYFFFKTDDI